MTTDEPAAQPTPSTRHALRSGTSTPAAATAVRADATLRPRPVVVAATVVTALLLAAAGATGERTVEIAVVVLTGLVVAAGWPRLVGSRSPVGMSLVLALTAVSLAGALLLQDEEPYLEHVPAAVALGVIAMCLHPLVQASARVHLARSLAVTALGVLIIGGGGLMVSTVVGTGQGPVVIVGIGLAVAALVDLALERPGRSRWMIPAAMLVGALAALAGNLVLDGGLAAWPALLGVTSAGVAVALRRALSQQDTIDSPPAALAAGAASVLVVAPLVHLVARLPLA